MSDFVNPFALKANEYKRDIDVLKNAIEDTAIYLHTTTGKPLDTCKSYIKKQLQPGGRFAFKDRKITYLSKNDIGDREEYTTTLSRYFSDVRKNEEILAPTGTTYLPAKVKRSKLSDYQKENVRIRGVAKKEMFKAVSSIRSRKNKRLHFYNVPANLKNPLIYSFLKIKNQQGIN